MGFRINTNIGAMNAHNWGLRTAKNLDNALQKLSSGLRINKAADDSSGMAIADSLKAQSLGLGQARANANDGIGVTQTADGALDEYINIINTVRTKAIQAASDGQNAQSRQAIQNDITKLLQNAQNIASTTSFNGQTLLNGAFGNKSFHIGAYAGETVQIDINDTRTSQVGEFAQTTSSKIASGAMAATSVTITVGVSGTTVGGAKEFTAKLDAATGALHNSDSSYDNAVAIANAINTAAQTTGAMVRASVVELTGSTNASPSYGVRLDSAETITIGTVSGMSGMKSASASLKNNLSTIDVTTREKAELAVITTDYALKELDQVRSEIGSVQNQLESTIRNISVTQVNVTAAESQIRDVDFASESSNFAKQNILAQSGTYALSQANAAQQNVMRLLQ